MRDQIDKRAKLRRILFVAYPEKKLNILCCNFILDAHVITNLDVCFVNFFAFKVS